MRQAKTGLFLYARMMSALSEPMTAREVAISVSIGDSACRAIMCELHGMALIHVCGWKRVGKHGRWDRVYSRGAGEDAVAPLTTMGKPGKVRAPVKTRPRAAVISFASLWSALESPVATKELAEETGLSEQTAWRFVKFTRELNLVGIAAWCRVNTSPVAMFALGVTDKARPRREASKRISKRYRENAKARERHLTLGQLAFIQPVFQEAA